MVCGGAAALAGSLLLTPVAIALGNDGLPGLLALLYPLIDLVLATVVARPGRAAAAGPLADDVLPRRGLRGPRGGRLEPGAEPEPEDVRLQRPHRRPVRHRVRAGVVGSVRPTPRRRRHPGAATAAGTLVGAATIALVALAFRPSGVPAWYVTVPALVTLIAAGGRLVLALREAQGAAEALRLSRTDELTGLPNRRAVLQDLEVGLQDGRPLALMLLDLDGFKDINDSLGHAAGDAVLEAAADRMRRIVRPDLAVARLGGDEFAVVVREGDADRAARAGPTVAVMLLEPLRVEGLELAIRASIGITVKGAGDLQATDLLRRADVAMYEAKVSRSGRAALRRRRATGSPGTGCGWPRTCVAASPRTSSSSGTSRRSTRRTRRITGVEALVRWQHPTEGLLLPLNFLPDARRSGLMLALSEAVAHQVVTDARRWVDSGFSFRVGMNCAPPELLGGSLLPRLFEAIDHARLPGGQPARRGHRGLVPLRPGAGPRDGARDP